MILFYFFNLIKIQKRTEVETYISCTMKFSRHLIRMMINYCSSRRRRTWEMKKQMAALIQPAALQDEGRWPVAMVVFIYGKRFLKIHRREKHTHRETYTHLQCKRWCRVWVEEPRSKPQISQTKSKEIEGLNLKRPVTAPFLGCRCLFFVLFLFFSPSSSPPPSILLEEEGI